MRITSFITILLIAITFATVARACFSDSFVVGWVTCMLANLAMGTYLNYTRGGNAATDAKNSNQTPKA